MSNIFNGISIDWPEVVIPVVVFAVSLIALFWLRKMALDRLEHWSGRINWSLGNGLLPGLRLPATLLCLILSIYLGLVVSAISGEWKNRIGNILWSLFVLAVAITIINLTAKMLNFYATRYKIPPRARSITNNVIRIIFLVIAALIILQIWGVPTSPVILLIAVVIIIVIVAFRDSLPDLFASFQIAALQEYKMGDYIKIEGGEEGYITEISWSKTKLRSPDGSLVMVPNNLLIHRKVINYGRPLKKARNPFKFNARVHLVELTGLIAGNLNELKDILQTVPDPVIYYHTHHYLEEHQYLTPELTNDFAAWVKDALGNAVLAERLAVISSIEFTSLTNFRDKAVNVIETYLAQNHYPWQALPGREFHFLKSVDVILPTPFVAHDLREFIEDLRQITPNSLYYHFFESRMRLKNGLNDFASWLAENMDETELSRQIAQIDPYTYTLEGLRSVLIQTIEKHIK
jgi:small-conductance mechanosensitive channel